LDVGEYLSARTWHPDLIKKDWLDIFSRGLQFRRLNPMAWVSRADVDVVIAETFGQAGSEIIRSRAVTRSVELERVVAREHIVPRLSLP